MTLVLGYVSKRFAVLASDRMITKTANGQSAHKEIINKSMVLAGQAIMGFAGVANLGGGGSEPTTHAVADILGSVTPTDYYRTLSEEVPKVLLAQGQAGQPLGFLTVGYMTAPDSDRRVPFIGTVANYDTEHPTSRPASSHFELRFEVVDNGEGDDRLWSIGAELPFSEIEEARNEIRRVRVRGKKKILGITEVMVGVIRKEADRNREVGESVQVTILPRSAVPALSLGVSTAPSFEPIDNLVTLFAPSDEALAAEMIPGVMMISPTIQVSEFQVFYGEAAKRPMPRPDIDGYFEGFGI